MWIAAFNFYFNQFLSLFTSSFEIKIITIGAERRRIPAQHPQRANSEENLSQLGLTSAFRTQTFSISSSSPTQPLMSFWRHSESISASYLTQNFLWLLSTFKRKMKALKNKSAQIKIDLKIQNHNKLIRTKINYKSLILLNYRLDQWNNLIFRIKNSK